MRELSESRHWTRTERLAGQAAAIVSIDVRRVLMEADYRRRHPGWWVRLTCWWKRICH